MNGLNIERMVRQLLGAALVTAATAVIALAVGYWAAMPKAKIQNPGS